MFADDVVCGSEARHMREVTENPIFGPLSRLWAESETISVDAHSHPLFHFFQSCSTLVRMSRAAA